MMALAAQTSILSTMIVALVIIAIVAWIIRGMIQKKKRSGTGTSGCHVFSQDTYRLLYFQNRKIHRQ